MESKLLKKSFCLKDAKIFGGFITFRECSTSTNTRANCSDTEVTTSDDNGGKETCVTYDCE